MVSWAVRHLEKLPCLAGGTPGDGQNLCGLRKKENSHPSSMVAMWS